ncbi:MAG: hypothetical protein B7Y80_12450 [Hyphomicrobium sp. 32-62-53]|nr:MAG: hypothetical protein B7Z29_00460 [Hyphomicrobium sp. 12-62-95]OYX99307.1 MAG: hypothetical protein B7Y80_12450 [Hyphomicrobium sp. 32-62-53]
MQKIKTFSHDVRGVIAPLFGLFVMVLIAAIGVSVDYSNAMRLRSDLDGAADAATLATVQRAQEAFAAGDEDWRKSAEKVGAAMFKTNVDAKAKSLKINDVKIKVSRNNNAFAAALKYSATHQTAFMQILGRKEVELSNRVSANSAIANYIDVHLLIDASASMGIGATPEDQETLVQTIGCALACHHDEPSWAKTRQSRAKLRIDYVRDAVREFIRNLEEQGHSGNRVRLSIHLFQNDIRQIFATSSDLEEAYAAAEKIDLLSYPGAGSNSAYSLKQLSQKLQSGGDGSRKNNRKSYVVLLSDGIESGRLKITADGQNVPDPNLVPTSPYHIEETERLQVMESDSCTEIKSQGHTLLTAHIEYLIPKHQVPSAVARFDFIKNQLIDKSYAEFAACASKPEFAYKAGESREIAPMFDKILSDILPTRQLVLTE